MKWKRKISRHLFASSVLVACLLNLGACQQSSGYIPGGTGNEDEELLPAELKGEAPGGSACNPAKYQDPSVTDSTNLSGAFACTLYPLLHFPKSKGGFGCYNCRTLSKVQGAPFIFV